MCMFPLTLAQSWEKPGEVGGMSSLFLVLSSSCSLPLEKRRKVVCQGPSKKLTCICSFDFFPYTFYCNTDIGQYNPNFCVYAFQSGGGMSLALEEKILNIENNVVDIKEAFSHSIIIFSYSVCSPPRFLLP